jgi:hypothetical protein
MWTAILVVSLLALVYFMREACRAWRSPELKNDLERLRQQRRIRKSRFPWRRR